MEKKCGNCKHWDKERTSYRWQWATCQVVENMVLPESVILLQTLANYGRNCQLFEPRQENREETVLTHKDVVLDRLVTLHALRGEHETNPKLAVSDLIKREVAIALDPAVSKRAKKLQDTIPDFLIDTRFSLQADSFLFDDLNAIVERAQFPIIVTGEKEDHEIKLENVEDWYRYHVAQPPNYTITLTF